MIYIDLVLTTGELVRVSMPDDVEDEFHDALLNAIKTREWLPFGSFERCTAELMGLRMDRVHGDRIVGTL